VVLIRFYSISTFIVDSNKVTIEYVRGIRGYAAKIKPGEQSEADDDVSSEKKLNIANY
jgi:hypothetical protein